MAMAKEYDGTSVCGGIKEQVNFCRLLLLQKLTYKKKHASCKSSRKLSGSKQGLFSMALAAY